jgi:hypothetical protein
VQLERAAPEVLVAKRVVAKNVFALLGEGLMFLLRIKSKSANKRNGNHEWDSDLLHEITPLLSQGLLAKCSPEKLFNVTESHFAIPSQGKSQYFAVRCKWTEVVAGRLGALLELAVVDTPERCSQKAVT